MSFLERHNFRRRPRFIGSAASGVVLEVSRNQRTVDNAMLVASNVSVPLLLMGRDVSFAPGEALQCESKAGSETRGL